MVFDMNSDSDDEEAIPALALAPVAVAHAAWRGGLASGIPIRDGHGRG